MYNIAQRPRRILGRRLVLALSHLSVTDGPRIDLPEFLRGHDRPSFAALLSRWSTMIRGCSSRSKTY